MGVTTVELLVLLAQLTQSRVIKTKLNNMLIVTRILLFIGVSLKKLANPIFA